MKLSKSLIAISMAFYATAAQATPVTVFSTSELEASFQINGGELVDGLLMRSPGQLLTLEGSRSSGVDATNIEQNETSFGQVGNPFAEPPLPYRSVRSNSTNLEGSPLEGAQGSHDISVVTRADIDTAHTFERALDNEGSASIFLATDPVNAAGVSSFDISRSYELENLTDGIISFNIMVGLDALLTADVMGDVGLATTQLSYSLLFGAADGVGITITELSPFSGAIDDAASGASVTQSVFADNSGLIFDAEAISDAASGGGLASSDGSASYMFSIQMMAGTSFTMTDTFSQRNEAVIRLQDPLTPVPLPASGVLLIAGLFGLLGLRRRASSAVSRAYCPITDGNQREMAGT